MSNGMKSSYVRDIGSLKFAASIQEGGVNSESIRKDIAILKSKLSSAYAQAVVSIDAISTKIENKEEIQASEVVTLLEELEKLLLN